MFYCYLCGDQLTDEKKHGEHIIQNAIGGTLISDEILCKDCGNDLGDEIDVPFVKIFESIAIRLDIKTDRKRSSKKAMGKIGDIEVIIDENKVIPSKPQHKVIGNTLLIVSPEQHAQGYAKKVSSHEDMKNIRSIEYIHDMTGAGNIEIPFTLQNELFKRGLAKIAIGYASHMGVSREEMPLALNCHEKQIRNEICVIPFIPTGDVDFLIERSRPHLDSEDYPSHTIVLFTLKTKTPDSSTIKNLLICYIELFGTFQHYIILNEDYKSKIYNNYRQFVLRKNGKTITHIPGPKDLHLILSETGLSANDLKGLNNKQALNKIQNEYDRIKYQTSLASYLNDLWSKVSLTINLYLAGIENHCEPNTLDLVRKFIGDEHDKRLESLMLFKKNYSQYNKHNDDSFFDESPHRQSFYRPSENTQFERCSNFFESLSTYHSDRQKAIDYGHYKFESLSLFIQRLRDQQSGE